MCACMNVCVCALVRMRVCTCVCACVRSVPICCLHKRLQIVEDWVLESSQWHERALHTFLAVHCMVGEVVQCMVGEVVQCMVGEVVQCMVGEICAVHGR